MYVANLNTSEYKSYSKIILNWNEEVINIYRCNDARVMYSYG
jgi:hypothetical protein